MKKKNQKNSKACRAALYHGEVLTCLLKLVKKEVENEIKNVIQGQSPCTISDLSIIEEGDKYCIVQEGESIMELAVENDEINHIRSFKSGWIFKNIDQGTHAELWARILEKDGLVKEI